MLHTFQCLENVSPKICRLLLGRESRVECVSYGPSHSYPLIYGENVTERDDTGDDW